MSIRTEHAFHKSAGLYTHAGYDARNDTIDVVRQTAEKHTSHQGISWIVLAARGPALDRSVRPPSFGFWWHA